MDSLSRVIEIDEINRRHYIEDGLLTLSEVNELPIDANLSNIDGIYIIPKNYKNGSFVPQAEYNDKFLTNYEIIAKILRELTGVVLCGGAAVWGLTNLSNAPPNDFDLFMYGEIYETIEKKNTKIDKIIKILYGKYKELYIHQVNGVINIETIKRRKADISLKFQIILRDYYSISEIIHSFDIPCCAVAWDGTTTYMTQFAHWSNLHKIIVAMPKYRSHTYELRLMKYYNKGYAILFPNLKLPTLNSKIILSTIEFDIIYVNKNMVIAEVNIIPFDKINIIIPSYENNDYDTISLDKFYKITLKANMPKVYDLLNNNKYYNNNKYNNKYPSIFVATHHKKNYNYIIKETGFLERRIVVTGENIESHNIAIKVPIHKLISNDEYCNWATRQSENLILYEDEIKLNEHLLQSLLGENYEQFALDNNLEDIKYQLACISEILEEVTNPTIYILATLKQNIIDHLISIYNSKKDNLYSFMIPINRAINLTGSLRPCGQTNEIWYGENFSEEKMPQQYTMIQEFLNMYETEVEKPICPMCINEINLDDTNMIRFKCGHKFHYHNNGICSGVFKWLKPNYKKDGELIPPTCPECRQEFPKEDKKLKLRAF